jgi:predicted DNA binding CopG/RHH family protein
VSDDLREYSFDAFDEADQVMRRVTVRLTETEMAAAKERARERYLADYGIEPGPWAE